MNYNYRILIVDNESEYEVSNNIPTLDLAKEVIKEYQNQINKRNKMDLDEYIDKYGYVGWEGYYEPYIILQSPFNEWIVGCNYDYMQKQTYLDFTSTSTETSNSKSSYIMESFFEFLANCENEQEYKIEINDFLDDFFSIQNENCKTNSLLDRDDMNDFADSLWKIKFLSLKDVRKILNLSKKEFCSFFGVPKRTVENWERNNNCPSYTKVAMYDSIGVVPLDRPVERIEDSMLHLVHVKL